MTVTAVVTRNRKARGTSSWDFLVSDPATKIVGSVLSEATGTSDLAFERAGWRAVEIVQAIIGELTDLPVTVTFEGLEPHPAGQKAEKTEAKVTSAIGTPNQGEQSSAVKP